MLAALGARTVLQLARTLGAECLIERKEVRSASNVDFVIPPGWDNYRLRWFDVTSTGALVDNVIRLSQDGGGTFLSGVGDYAWAGQRIRIDGSLAQTSDAGVATSIKVSDRSEDESNGEVIFWGPMRPTLTASRLISCSSTNNEAANYNRYDGFGRLALNTLPFNGVRFMSSTISRGTFELYSMGRKK